jgi:hypothetical protein
MVIKELTIDTIYTVFKMLGLKHGKIDENKDHDILEFPDRGKILIDRLNRIYETILDPPSYKLDQPSFLTVCIAFDINIADKKNNIDFYIKVDESKYAINKEYNCYWRVNDQSS